MPFISESTLKLAMTNWPRSPRVKTFAEMFRVSFPRHEDDTNLVLLAHFRSVWEQSPVSANFRIVFANLHPHTFNPMSVRKKKWKLSFGGVNCRVSSNSKGLNFTARVSWAKCQDCCRYYSHVKRLSFTNQENGTKIFRHVYI